MQIKDLGSEAIDAILAEAVDGMERRTRKAWKIHLDGETGDMQVRTCGDGKLYGTSNVRPQPFLRERLHGEQIGGATIPEAIRFRAILRRNILEATQALTPVPGASDIPAALVSTWAAIGHFEQVLRDVDIRASSSLPGLNHHLHCILDHLTGNDHSGCSSKPSVADYGRVTALTPTPKRSPPLQADIDAVRDALREAEAEFDPVSDDGDGQAHVVALRDTLDGLLAEQRREA